MKRQEQIERLKEAGQNEWDIAVIGGGATGAGIALDSALRGYRTVLFERADFSAGTSSRSTKLIHGGVRYLAKGDLLLVMEALRERGIILKNAPHLTNNQEFLVPFYKWSDAFVYYIGLKFYDLLSGRLSLGKSRFSGKKETLEKIPNIREKGLKGSILYHDGQFDDARLNIELLKSASVEGACILNYFEVKSIRKNNKGKINGVDVHDNVSGEKYVVNAKAVINATGVFANELIKTDNEKSDPVLRPSRGVHLITDISFLGGSTSLMIPSTEDKRVLFLIPWKDKAILGTTDIPVDNAEAEPVASSEEIDFILRNASGYLKRAPRTEDIAGVFAGLRPLAAEGKKGKGVTREISRRHKIIVSESGLVTITGGKWTTYRLMAKETVERAIVVAGLKKSVCTTKQYQLGNICTELPDVHMAIYGEAASEIHGMNSKMGSLSERVHPDFPVTRAEIVWICRNEMPVNVEDILSRRLRYSITDPDASIEMAEAVADIMAEETGKDENWRNNQIKLYLEVIKNHQRH